LPTHRILSRLRRVFDIEEPEEREVAADIHDASGLGMEDCENHEPAIQAVENLICDGWNRNLNMNNMNSDEVDEPSPLIDSDGEDDFDWELLEGGLSAWDQLGEGYERDAAAVGGFLIK